MFSPNLSALGERIKISEACSGGAPHDWFELVLPLHALFLGYQHTFAKGSRPRYTAVPVRTVRLYYNETENHASL
jgi:hypothetical protein